MGKTGAMYMVSSAVPDFQQEVDWDLFEGFPIYLKMGKWPTTLLTISKTGVTQKGKKDIFENVCFPF